VLLIHQRHRRTNGQADGRTTCNLNTALYTIMHRAVNKTAELSQRRPRNALNIWVPWKVLRVLTTHPGTFPETCNGLLFRSILRMCVQKLKFVALPVPEIIGGTQKIWAVPGYDNAPFSPKILKGFCSHRPCEYIPAKFEVRSFIRSRDNMGYSKNLGSFCIRPRSIFPKFLIGFRSHGPSEYIFQIWRS